MKNICFKLVVLLAILTSCDNQEWVYPDYEYQTTYFAYQYPVRTITLGEDVFDTSLDNQYKFQIMATTGGVYDNKKDITVGVTVDNSLSNNLLFNPNGTGIQAMPGNYYKLVSDKIVIPRGKLIGGVEVELTPAFFADPLALKNTYVIPMRMTSVENADSILSGTPLVVNPNRVVAGDWGVAPKDFVLYAVKYINPWHGFYLRRGKDVVAGKNGNTALNQTIVREQQYVENDEVVKLTTQSLSQIAYPVIYKDSEGRNIEVNLILTFDEQGNCTVSSASTAYTVTGSGKFVKKGEKNSWGNTDRDALYLDYKVDFDQMQITSTDVLVMRNRGVAIETFSPVLK
ncbi:DUF1735 domain-containing protein [Pontibacter qinzhouensis]|uniref:DUF1735 domain-containing protein n=1 Tax=Pontibacter qinzhouensis TaxID=2603253 RepID=A0A5C8K7A5_9BACT|nr:DUF5627 domain-containing protein [Pontibacter qinzhouensis]TXK48148.1 DUF1735 domain-containing protein [Pontibacter qinzhouensis]